MLSQFQDTTKVKKVGILWLQDVKKKKLNLWFLFIYLNWEIFDGLKSDDFLLLSPLELFLF